MRKKALKPRPDHNPPSYKRKDRFENIIPGKKIGKKLVLVAAMLLIRSGMKVLM